MWRHLAAVHARFRHFAVDLDPDSLLEKYSIGHQLDNHDVYKVETINDSVMFASGDFSCQS